MAYLVDSLIRKIVIQGPARVRTQ